MAGNLIYREKIASSTTEYGWKLIKIEEIDEYGAVRLSTRFSVLTKIFKKAQCGDIWAILHTPSSPFALGAIEEGVLVYRPKST